MEIFGSLRESSVAFGNLAKKSGIVVKKRLDILNKILLAFFAPFLLLSGKKLLFQRKGLKNGGHARKRNRCASTNLVTEHNLREFTFVISLIIYLTYNVPTGRASVKNTVPQSFSPVLFCVIL